MIEEEECELCHGEGEYEVFDCHDGSNECCGACYKFVKCEACG